MDSHLMSSEFWCLSLNMAKRIKSRERRARFALTFLFFGGVKKKEVETVYSLS